MIVRANVGPVLAPLAAAEQAPRRIVKARAGASTAAGS
jgi:hypothetical protein